MKTSNRIHRNGSTKPSKVQPKKGEQPKLSLGDLLIFSPTKRRRLDGYFYDKISIGKAKEIYNSRDAWLGRARELMAAGKLSAAKEISNYLVWSERTLVFHDEPHEGCVTRIDLLALELS